MMNAASVAASMMHTAAPNVTSAVAAAAVAAATTSAMATVTATAPCICGRDCQYEHQKKYASRSQHRSLPFGSIAHPMKRGHRLANIVGCPGSAILP